MRKTNLIAVLIWVVALSAVVCAGLKRAEHLLSHVLADDANELQKLLDVAFAYNRSIAGQMEMELGAEQARADIDIVSRLRDYPELNAFGLSQQSAVLVQPLESNLTGMGSVNDLSHHTLKEISAALTLNLSAPLKDRQHHFIWSYYTSKNGFLLLSPFVSPQDYRMTVDDYTRPFWQVAKPENNPKRETKISNLYQDAAGQGMMISVSTPVYYQDEFRGAVSLDVGMSYLREVLQGVHPELSITPVIITTQGQVALTCADEVNITPGDDFIDLNGVVPFRLVQQGGELYMVSGFISEKFQVAYRLSRSEFWSMVFQQSLLSGLVVSMLVLVAWLLVKLRFALAKATSLAEHDGLTGLLNRATFLEQASRSLDYQAKQERFADFSVLMIDVDHFKSINDRFGHHAGDLAIKCVADHINGILRKSDLVGRFGGEEFIVALPATDSQSAFELAERIRLSMPSASFGVDHELTVSIGLSDSVSLNSVDMDHLCRCADSALYSAKRNGRNRTITYDDSVLDMNERIYHG